MGLIDVLNGMQNGPHGQRDPSASTSSKSGGMSPMTMAILGLLGSPGWILWLTNGLVGASTLVLMDRFRKQRARVNDAEPVEVSR